MAPETSSPLWPETLRGVENINQIWLMKAPPLLRTHARPSGRPPVSGGGATCLERRRLYQLISPVCVRFNNICVTQEARWAWTTLDARQLRPADSPGRRAAVGHSAAAPRTTCACRCSPTSWCSARLACVFAAPGLDKVCPDVFLHLHVDVRFLLNVCDRAPQVVEI